MRQTQEERFWRLVERTDPSECWVWKGTKNQKGYGRWRRFWLSGAESAHRVAWAFAAARPLPEGMQVLHRCDNPPCCNPAHLFLGTHEDNMADMAIKGRAHGPNPRTRGELHGGTRLTNAQAMEIYRRAKAGERPVDVARDYGIERATVSQISRGVTWRSVTGAQRP